MLCSLCQTDNPAAAGRCRACGAALGTAASAHSETPDALPAGALLIGTYAVESVLGQGGFGITYRAHDQMLDRRVAVKEFFPAGCRRQNSDVAASRGQGQSDFREARAQFLAEARTLARCHHPGIVSVYSAFEANQTAYMVMELLHGQSLAQLLTARGGRLNEAEAVGVIERVGAALAFVHGQDLLHRDIKPDNIMVCDDARVMLIDFGTARETIGGGAANHTVVVTPGYAPLEQYAKQAKRGPFTDIYSLAATLYHLLTGQMPPAASDRAMGVALRSARELNPRISASVARAVESALQMEIARRPQSVQAFLDLLHAPAESGESPAMRRAITREEFGRDESEDALRGSRPAARGANVARDEITPSLDAPRFSDYSDALKAQRQSHGVFLPGEKTADEEPADETPVVSRPVVIAPQTPVAKASVAKAPNSAPGSAGAGGGVTIRKNSDSGGLVGAMGWILGAVVVVFALASLVSPNKAPTSSTVPPSGAMFRDYQPLPPQSANSSPSETERNRAAATKAWNALPVLTPVASVALPVTKPRNAADGLREIQGGGIEFSPDGKRLAYSDNQNVVRVLSLPSREVVRTLKLAPKSPVHDLMFAPDNQTVAVSLYGEQGRDSQSLNVNQVDIWSLETGKRIGTFATQQKTSSVWPEAVFNDGRVLLRTMDESADGSLMWEWFGWNPKTSKREISALANRIEGISYGVASPDGKEFAAGDFRGDLQLFDLRSGKLKFQQNFASLSAGDYFDRFGTEVSSGSDSNAPLAVRGIDYAPSGQWLASRNDAEITVFNAKAKKVGALTIDSKTGMWFTVSPDGQWVAARGALPYSPSGDVLWNVETGQEIRLQAPLDNLMDWGFSPDGQQLYGIFAGEKGFQFVTWDVDAKPRLSWKSSGQTTLPFSSIQHSPSVALAQTDNLLAIATDSGVESAQKGGGSAQRLPVAQGEIMELALAPDGRFLAQRQSDGTVQLWDVQAQKVVFAPPLAQSASSADAVVSSENLHQIAFSPDSRLWALARPDGASSVVELRTLSGKFELLASFAQTERANALEFSPDGKALIVGGDAGTVQWFDVASRQQRDSIKTGTNIVDLVFGARHLVVLGNSATTLLQVPANSGHPLQAATKTRLPAGFDAARDDYTPAAISPDGHLLAVAQSHDAVQIWDVATKTPLQNLLANQDGMALIYGVRFSANGDQISVIGQQLKGQRLFAQTWKRPEIK